MAIREIIFRGKRVDNGEWVYGSPIFQDGYVLIRFWNSEEYEYEEYLVIPETIGQYTGLTDKNGKKIFEGDIVSISGELKGMYTCVWEEHNFEYEFDNKTMRLCIACEYSEEIKVIGNIHDNPELLKGGEE